MFDPQCFLFPNTTIMSLNVKRESPVPSLRRWISNSYSCKRVSGIYKLPIFHNYIIYRMFLGGGIMVSLQDHKYILKNICCTLSLFLHSWWFITRFLLAELHPKSKTRQNQSWIFFWSSSSLSFSFLVLIRDACPCTISEQLHFLDGTRSCGVSLGMGNPNSTEVNCSPLKCRESLVTWAMRDCLGGKGNEIGGHNKPCKKFLGKAILLYQYPTTTNKRRYGG